ncbi:MAG: carboxypeptidase-like regulatory domain-containing protein, partial [Ginsengibacter sp.]
MKKKFCVAVIAANILFAFFNPLSAQTSFTKKIETVVTVSGKVTALSTGLALPGASIYIPDLEMGTTTDASGNYVLHNVPAGNYLLQADYVGYKNSVKKVLLNHNVEVDFALEISITEESEIVITGSSKATTIKRNPIPIV